MFQSNRAVTGSTEMLEAGTRRVDGYDSNLAVNSTQGGGHIASHANEPRWLYSKPGMELHSAPGSIPCIPVPTQIPSAPPPPQISSSPFMRPVYLPPNSSWDPRGSSHNRPLNPISPGVVPNNFHGNAIVPPFIHGKSMSVSKSVSIELEFKHLEQEPLSFLLFLTVLILY